MFIGLKNRKDDINVVYHYVDKIKNITYEDRYFYETVKRDFDIALESNDREALEDMVKKIDVFLEKAIRTLKKLNPPYALRSYHKYVVNAYFYKKKANMLYFSPVREEYSFCSDMAEANYIDSLKELRTIYNVLGAPQEKKDDINRKLADQGLQ
ncbi:MAG: hypothetical protein PHZ27_03165 [Candidatus Omnitrophica bacterium]|nr:hypothetical protein [Candidatus Omnitrophota bacterium]